MSALPLVSWVKKATLPPVRPIGIVPGPELSALMTFLPVVIGQVVAIVANSGRRFDPDRRGETAREGVGPGREGRTIGVGEHVAGAEKLHGAAAGLGVGAERMHRAPPNIAQVIAVTGRIRVQRRAVVEGVMGNVGVTTGHGDDGGIIINTEAGLIAVVEQRQRVPVGGRMA